MPNDKGNVFRLIKKESYEQELVDVLNCPQFKKLEGESDVIVKIEKEMKRTLLKMRRQELISEPIYHRIRTTGGAPAPLYGSAKVHKIDTPLKQVLSILGSSYHNLHIFRTPFFKKLPVANIDISIIDSHKELELFALDENEQIVPLDVNILFTNVPLSEAKEIALRCLYSSDYAPDLERSTLKFLLKLAVTNVHSKCNNKLYYQEVDGLAMGASFTVRLANNWKKLFQKKLKKESCSPARLAEGSQ